MKERIEVSTRVVLIVAGVYALITVLMTYPVAFKLSSAVAGFPAHDNLQYLWSLWWAKKAIIELHTSPANVTYLYYPTGAYHPVLSVTPYIELVSLPLSLLLNPIAVYNIQFLSSFVLSGLTMYLLCRELTGNRWAAFVGGLIFAFFPNKIGHALPGHLPQIVTYWFPLYALFLLRLRREPCVKNSLLCGLFLALSLLVNVLHIAHFLIPFTAIFLLYHCLADRTAFFDRRFISSLGLAALVTGLLTAPFFVPFLVQKATGGLEFLEAGGAIEYSADLLAFFSPSSFHPVLSKMGILPSFATKVIGEERDLKEKVMYAGAIPLGLACLGLKRGGRKTGVWATLGLCAALFSLGPFLKVGGELVQFNVEGTESYFPLPFALLKKLPFYEWDVTPGRFDETVMFAVAILASYGAAAILGRWGGHRSKVGLLIALSLAILFEYTVVFPFPVKQKGVPSIFREMAEDERDYAVLNVPIAYRGTSDYAMYYQTFHQHKMVGGFIHRHPPGTKTMRDLIARIVEPGQGPGDVSDHLLEVACRQSLQNLKIGRVIVHRHPLNDWGKEEITLSFLERLLSKPIFEDSQIVVFEVPEAEVEIVNEKTVALRDQVVFLGYEVDNPAVNPGDTIHLTLYWRALARLDQDYTVFTHLLDSDGLMWEQMDSQPLCGFLPTSIWPVGRVMVDHYEFVVAPNTPPGEYRVEVGMYLLETMERLPALDEEGIRLPEDRILLEQAIIVE
jgi:hypothetical protein